VTSCGHIRAERLEGIGLSLVDGMGVAREHPRRGGRGNGPFKGHSIRKAAGHRQPIVKAIHRATSYLHAWFASPTDCQNKWVAKRWYLPKPIEPGRTNQNAPGRLKIKLPDLRGRIAMVNLEICRVCGTRLHVEACRRCAGTGKTRSWIFRRRCPVCTGTGQTALCPNWLMHVGSAPRSPDIEEQHRQEMIKRGSAQALRDRNQPKPLPPPPPRPPSPRR
jgi:hypothetical protein